MLATMRSSTGWIRRAIPRQLLSLDASRRSLTATTTSTKMPIRMGCVCYDPAVGDIWSGIRSWLVQEKGVAFEYQLYDTYEDQVQALVHTNDINVAWNGPVAHVLTEQQHNANVVSLGMRDVDRDFESVVVVRRNAGISSLQELKGRHILTGASDSPQAHVVPLHYLRETLGNGDNDTVFGGVTTFDIDLGKHGDTALGEIEALKVLSSLTQEGDAAVVSKMMWDRAIAGQIAGLDPQIVLDTCQELSSLDKTAVLPTFDHCQFDALLEDGNDDFAASLHHFGSTLLSMNMKNSAEEERLMKLEGIQESWELPRQEGYNVVRKAMGIRNLQLHTPATNFNYQQRSYSTTTARQQQQRRAFSSTTTTKTPPRRVAVVGAGVAGLQVIHALRAKGFQVTALEASAQVGGLWKANYANFGVQVPKQLYEFPDFPMTSVAWGDYATGPQVQEYIESYVDEYKLRDAIQFNTKVTSAKQQAKDGSWELDLETKGESGGDVKKDTVSFDYLVMATGLYSGNKGSTIPAIPGLEGFSGKVVHSENFEDASMAKDQRVVVIGGGKSALDCALEASKAGATSVTLLERSPNWPTPRKIAGIIPFQYIFLSRFGQALVSLHSGVFPSNNGGVLSAFRNSGIGPAIVKPIFGIVEALFAYQFGMNGDLRPKADVVKNFYKTALVLNSDFYQAQRDEKIAVKVSEVDKCDSDRVLRLKDGSTVEADMIVSGTGFAQDYSIFSDPTTRKDLDIQDDGMYLYRYMIPEKVSNLAFIGHIGAISNISSYGLQAEWLARNLTGELVSGGTYHGETSPEAIKQEIEQRTEWARSFMPESAYRGMLVLLHQTHYHDQLLRDMGYNPSRKSNPISEYLMPYEPADYSDIIGKPSLPSEGRKPVNVNA